MKEVIVFGIGAVTGAAAATLFTNQVRKEIAVLSSIARTDFSLIVTRFHTVISRLEAIAHKLEAKL